MKKSRFSEEKIIAALKQAEALARYRPTRFDTTMSLVLGAAIAASLSALDEHDTATLAGRVDRGAR